MSPFSSGRASGMPATRRGQNGLDSDESTSSGPLTVTDDFVDGCADRTREFVVTEWRRVRVSLDAFFVDDPIQLEGRDARADVGSGDVENLTAELRG